MQNAGTKLHPMDKDHQGSETNSSVRLASKPLRIHVETIVSKHLGRQWTITSARDMTEFACHHAAILSDGSFSVFAKFSESPNGFEQFEVELAGLRFLSESSGVLTPKPIGIATVEGGSILVLESVYAVQRSPRHWREIGQTLARIHKVKGESFGLESHGYIGPLFQDNTPMSDWPAFYAERRLLPGLKWAVDSGNLPAALIPPVENILSRLPGLCGPDVRPSLLHGDAQQNNFISTEMGAVVIDPAPYYGHPEMDLAFIDIYQAVPDDVFDGYRNELPIDSGFWERRHLWRIWGYLAAVAVEGSGYLVMLEQSIRKYS